MKLENNLNSETLWEIYETTFVPEQVVTTGSNYMIGNGYFGYRGTFSDSTAADYVACVVSDTYDNADGVWKELVTAPNGLYTTFDVDGQSIRWGQDLSDGYRRELNVRYGEWTASGRAPGTGVTVRERRIASYDDIHLLASRLTISAERRCTVTVRSGIDGEVWSLNGDHFSTLSPTDDGNALEIAGVTGESGYDVLVRKRTVVTDGSGASVLPGDVEVSVSPTRVVQEYSVPMDAGEMLTVDSYVAIYSTNDLRNGSNPWAATAAPRPAVTEVRAAADRSLVRATEQGWEQTVTRHRAVWEQHWRRMDVEIAGDDAAQLFIRYNLYQNMIATPAHTDHLPIGARGLSCQAYQGAAFWDQEVFNLPVFLYTNPEIARNILIYRYKTLNGARKKARDLGYQGAFYAWISGDSGEEICPSYFFKDVLSGRRIRNHFNDWQIHISPDIAYTIWMYVTVTDDTEYLRRYGAEIVFEIARFLVSRSHFRKDRNGYDVIRVLGPDEYHENVDNNFFTNFQFRFAAEYAVSVYNWMAEHAPDQLSAIVDRIGLAEAERADWRDLAKRIVLPAPDEQTQVIEQFEGYFDLEDTRPEVIRERLLDPGEYWGWPNGIAVETQVTKQADVTQLFALYPREYPRSVMSANWEYYEPRTQHGSSLSPAVYAIVAAWVGRLDHAYRYFLKSCTIDLYNDNKAVSGGTFIGGIHTAAAGISWQVVVSGFAGMYLTDGGFGFRPHLPDRWQRLSFAVQRRGARIEVTVQRSDVAAAYTVTCAADAENPGPLEITVGDTTRSVAPGASVPFQIQM